MKETGTIKRQADGDLYECEMSDGRKYLIEISGYAGGEVDVPFKLQRNHLEYGESLFIEDMGYFSVVVQSEM